MRWISGTAQSTRIVLSRTCSAPRTLSDGWTRIEPFRSIRELLVRRRSSELGADGRQRDESCRRRSVTGVAQDSLSASEVIELLHLAPHATCGFVAETYRSVNRIVAGGLRAPFADGRPVGSALYFLVTPDRPVRLHRIRNDQLYHRYLGDPLEVLALYPDGSHAVEVVGPDLAAGNKVQLFLPGGTFHAARLRAGGSWFLGASTEWPGVEPSDVELGDVRALQEGFPGASAFLAEFARSAL